MEIVAHVENGQILLPKAIRLVDGAQVRVVVEDELVEQAPFEAEPLDEGEVASDLSWADGHRFVK